VSNCAPEHVSKLTVPAPGAVNEYQSPPLEVAGSPASSVAPRVDPETLPEWPLTTCAVPMSSLTWTFQESVKVPCWPLKPATRIQYFVPEFALNGARLSLDPAEQPPSPAATRLSEPSELPV
jgi:hypothetical protein